MANAWQDIIESFGAGMQRGIEGERRTRERTAEARRNALLEAQLTEGPEATGIQPEQIGLPKGYRAINPLREARRRGSARQEAEETQARQIGALYGETAETMYRERNTPITVAPVFPEEAPSEFRVPWRGAHRLEAEIKKEYAGPEEEAWSKILKQIFPGIDVPPGVAPRIGAGLLRLQGSREAGERAAQPPARAEEQIQKSAQDIVRNRVGARLYDVEPERYGNVVNQAADILRQGGTPEFFLEEVSAPEEQGVFGSFFGRPVPTKKQLSVRPKGVPGGRPKGKPTQRPPTSAPSPPSPAGKEFYYDNKGNLISK